MHPASYGGAQSGAQQATRAMHGGRSLERDPTRTTPSGRREEDNFMERIERERATLQAWFNANTVDCEKRPTFDEIKAFVLERLRARMRSYRQSAA